MKRHFGIIWFLPIFIASVLLSRFIPNLFGVFLFIISLFAFLFTKKCYAKRELFFKINFMVMLFFTVHFFGFCITELNTTEYDSPSDEATSNAISWVIYLPIAFVFSLTAGLLFDKWKNHKHLQQPLNN